VVSSASIAFVNAADLGRNLGVTSVTASYTCGSGSNRLLVVGVLGDATDFITGVTYAGASMTLINKQQAGTQRWSYLFYKLNPASGANNVVVSASSSTDIYAGAADYTGVKSSGQPDASTTNSLPTSVTSLTTSITTVTNNDWVIFLENGYSGGTFAPIAGAGDTIRVSDATDGAWGIFDSNGVVTPAGSYSVTTTRSPQSNNGVGHLVAAFQHA
jgi:hypothetical protein